MTYNDPLITYNGAPTDAFFAQMMAKLTSAPADTVAALQATTIPVDAQKMNGADIVGDGSEANPWRGVGVSP